MPEQFLYKCIPVLRCEISWLDTFQILPVKINGKLVSGIRCITRPFRACIHIIDFRYPVNAEFALPVRIKSNDNLILSHYISASPD